MPIGKSSIKRVTNNGYSNVKTKAPDMENSTVIANPSPQVVEKLLPKTEENAPAAVKKTEAAKKPTSTKKPAAKKPTAAKPAAKKPTEAKKPTAPAVKKEEAEKTADFYVNVGRDLPPHLL